MHEQPNLRDPSSGWLRVPYLLHLLPFWFLLVSKLYEVTTWKSRQGDSSKVTSLKAEIVELRKDVDYLKSTDFTSLREVAYDLDTSKTLEIPLSTTGEVYSEATAIDRSDA